MWQRWKARTEGWAAGLQLAGLALRRTVTRHGASLPPMHTDPSAFIARLGGSHRYILGYLTEEVLNRQPEDVRQFLLETAILDRLSGPLCDAVTGREDSAALLDELYKANLFLVPLDDEGRWYRYHQLFAELLRDLLVQQAAHAGGVLTALHRRASAWYASAKDAASLRVDDREAFAGAAIDHALAAGDHAGGGAG